MYKNCAFCGDAKLLKNSHVLPAFVFRWLRDRSGTGHIRKTDNPNLRVQDGLKLPWLCNDCEGNFCRSETAFATKVFHPWHEGHHRIRYKDWLLKFCVSVSWRVLKYSRGYNKNTTYTDEQDALMDQAEARWHAFLLSNVEHPGRFEQHLLIADIGESTNIVDLPTNFNRFMTGHVTLDIVGSKQSLMTFAKLGDFMIFGIIQKGQNRWKNTKVHVKDGLLKPDKFIVPAGLLDMFRQKAECAAAAISNISPAQNAKIDKEIFNNLEVFSKSAQFDSIVADARMFGADAVIHKDDS